MPPEPIDTTEVPVTPAQEIRLPNGASVALNIGDDAHGRRAETTNSSCDVQNSPVIASTSQPPTGSHIASAVVVETTPAKSADETAPVDEQQFFGLRRGDQWFVGCVACVALVLMTAQWVRLSSWGLKPVEIDRLPAQDYSLKLDINTALWAEWSQLEGLGPTLAKRIIEDRERNGPFRSVDDLIRVKGIGRKKLELLRPWLEFVPPASVLDATAPETADGVTP